MKTISNIDDLVFHLNLFKGGITTFTFLTSELLEYYVLNYSDMVDWISISKNQPLTETFIIKYKDKLDWNALWKNFYTNLTIDFVEKNIYLFNLYEVYSVFISDKYKMFSGDLIDNTIIKDKMRVIKKLIKKYSHKYQIDKLNYELNS